MKFVLAVSLIFSPVRSQVDTWRIFNYNSLGDRCVGGNSSMEIVLAALAGIGG